MIKFVYDGKWISVSAEGEGKTLPQTAIKCEAAGNEQVLNVCKDWLDVLGITETEYQVFIRLH